MSSTELAPLPATPTGRYRHYKGGVFQAQTRTCQNDIVGR